MKVNTVLEIYDLISDGIRNISFRKQSSVVRSKALLTINDENQFTKIAFDTRRINQETDYNPRRGLQNYHRSEQFISDALAVKLKAFAKVLKVANSIKSEYGKEPGWQDSYTRVLTSSINKGLRTVQMDNDFSESQPSVASIDYLQELMYVRYRMTPENLINMAEHEIKKILLNKDEFLLNQSCIIPPSDVSKYSYDYMVNKILKSSQDDDSEISLPNKSQVIYTDNLGKLFEVKATQNSPEVERTVTITIKDKISKNG